MTTRKVAPCTAADAAALAHNNMSAFWEDPIWILLWPKHIKLSYLIEQCAKCYPRNLLRDREKTRHQKAVDPVTGEVIGYARWILPDELVKGKEGEICAEGVVEDVSEEKRKNFEELAASAWWDRGAHNLKIGDTDDVNVAVRNRIVAEKPYISKWYLSLSRLKSLA
jgi:hypothetical protein